MYIMKLKPLNLLLIGLAVILLGAILRIMKFEYSNIILLLGLALEISAAIVYFSRHSKKKVE